MNGTVAEGIENREAGAELLRGNRVVNIGNSRCQRDFSKQGNARDPPPIFNDPDRSLELP